MRYRIKQLAHDEFVLEKAVLGQGHITGNFILSYERIVSGAKEKCEQILAAIKQGLRDENGERIVAEYEIEEK